jgi:signal transduction histidine kinase/CheY-like chemotaxis protein/HAMP domain-containing protein
LALNENGGRAPPNVRKRRNGAKQRSTPPPPPSLPSRAQLDALLDVLNAVSAGNFDVRLSARDSDGIMGEVAIALNAIVGRNAKLAREVARVENLVGREGRMHERVALDPEAKGGWGTYVRSINTLIADLLQPTTEVARVIGAVASGDLNQRMVLEIDGQPVRGEFLRTSTTVNTMVDQLSAFAGEVMRVAKEVGTEGKLGGQAAVPRAAGLWRDLTDNVNLLANNLTAQVRNVADVTTAVAKGDLSKKITVDAKGEVLELKNTINTMVDQLRAFAGEVTRVAKEVGTGGKLGGQAQVPGVSGTWKDLTDNVNVLAGNLTDQVRNIAKVTTAVANGDLSQKITVDARGEILELKNTINTMVDQLRSFASEVTRVAKEVGTEGKLGGQAEVRDVSGTWKDLTDNVNSMASNLTSQVRNIALVTTAVANGDLSKKITVDVKGEILELKNTINTMVDQLNSFASEVTRVAREVGTEGKLGGQAEVMGVGGVWKNLTDNVNFMASNLTTQVRGIVKVVTAVANGDLGHKLVVDAKGEVAALAETINNMTATLGVFAEQVGTVAREVGVEGKLGGQARVPGVAGIWKDLTDNVNFMASNLTTQVRGIVKVVTAVANGDVSQKLVGVEAKGEIAALADTINNMCDTLGTFADQVSTVAREVGIEGKLGGQAKVPGAMGTWRQLTDNVNQLAANLTSQVRAISEVATAVTKGDLTRSIDVQAEGEVALLKDNINQMILNLKETTEKNTEQDWLKTNLAKFSSMMQGQKNLETVSQMIMSELTPLVSAHYGAFFVMEMDDGAPLLNLTSSYAYRERKHVSNRFRIGEGLVGQCAREKKPILLTRVPADYVQISSGLGEAAPLSIIVMPVLFEGEVKAVIELASFHSFSAIHQLFLDQLMVSIGVVLNMITANMRTEQLLLQSQNLTLELQNQSRELQAQQQELRRTNLALEKQAEELEEKARLLAEQNAKVEIKNREVEQARLSLEEKAEQLALASKYKSEFLANMSHELRTPLNSLLILARLLADNTQANLTNDQVEYAKTIYASGNDLLSLINEILDLSRVEAGKMVLDPRPVFLDDLVQLLRRSFQPIADQKSLLLNMEVLPGTSETVFTDPQRLQQVLKNLLSNAFKFTHEGNVTLRMRPAVDVKLTSESLRRAPRVVAFEVSDTGIGIPSDKQRVIFEAFQQADGTTNRKYGGTGLGLTISRDISHLLGGEIHVTSVPDKGSTFTLYLPESLIHPIRMDGTVARKTDEAAIPGLASELVVEPSLAPRPLEDDRTSIVPGERVLLVIDDDENFARILMTMARRSGFKVVVATRGDTGLALAAQLRPNAITLDLQLPVHDGWTVLDRLKRNPLTRHIPVHVISIVERSHNGAALGAFAYLEKPVTKDALEGAFAHLKGIVDRSMRLLLLVEDNGLQQSEISRAIREVGGVEITPVSTAEEALVELEKRAFDCMVVDLLLPGLDGLSLIAEVKQQERWKQIPIVVYTGKDLDLAEEQTLKKLASSVIIKAGIGSLERLADQVGTFLHGVANDRESENAGRMRERLAGKTVLIVDDDTRNIFALSSALEAAGLNVLYAEDGRAGVELLTRRPSVDVVLMDMMMPEMDGYETIRAIRKEPRYASLPIIAVTARALPEERDGCIAAGASDYVAKPVDTDVLLERIAKWTLETTTPQGAP